MQQVANVCCASAALLAALLAAPLASLLAALPAALLAATPAPGRRASSEARPAAGSRRCACSDTPWDAVTMPKIIGGSLHEHREQTRQRLFTALSTLMSERGFDAISFADIAAAAGVGRTAVYNHFSDKEALLMGFIKIGRASCRERV